MKFPVCAAWIVIRLFCFKTRVFKLLICSCGEFSCKNLGSWQERNNGLKEVEGEAG